MSKIEELKKQNPTLNFNLIDLISKITPKSKYVELSVNLIKNRFQEENQKNRFHDVLRELEEYWGVPKELIVSKDYLELYMIYRGIESSFSQSEFKSLTKFIELNERKLIENSDLTTYKTFNDIELQNSLADLKLIDKEFQKQVLKIYEDDVWLVIKPLSWVASKKYGSSTKWCTASENDYDYFYRYARRGILIYAIDKKTGNKVAAFKNLDSSYERETSFWDIKDARVDSLETDLPNHIMDVFKDQFFNCKKSNWELLSDEERNSQLIWIENYHPKKLRSEPMIEETAMEESAMEVEYPQNDRINERVGRDIGIEDIPRESRIIQMYPDGPDQAG